MTSPPTLLWIGRLLLRKILTAGSQARVKHYILNERPNGRATARTGRRQTNSNMQQMTWSYFARA
ncbi:MAG: hypothetical protein PVJ43_08505 [Gemmatimonadales bacterium]